jgi:hypothetical protein
MFELGGRFHCTSLVSRLSVGVPSDVFEYACWNASPAKRGLKR